MRVRAAYISSVGTTGILLASALLMLAVVGTIVAFDRWPVTGSSAGVQSVAVPGGGTGSDVSAVRLRSHPGPVRLKRTDASRAEQRNNASSKLVGGLVRVPPGTPVPARFGASAAGGGSSDGGTTAAGSGGDRTVIVDPGPVDNGRTPSPGFDIPGTVSGATGSVVDVGGSSGGGVSVGVGGGPHLVGVSLGSTPVAVNLP